MMKLICISSFILKVIFFYILLKLLIKQQFKKTFFESKEDYPVSIFKKIAVSDPGEAVMHKTEIQLNNEDKNNK